jgi:AcrR family transcriptional regulator
MTSSQGPQRTPARPRPRRRFRNADQTRARILAAAVAEFAASGYRGGSLGAIAARAGTSQSGLLHHYPSKELLLAAVIDVRTAEHLDEYLAAKAEDPDLGFMTGMVRLMRRGARELDRTRLFTIVVAEAASPDHPAHEWAIRRYARTTQLVIDDLREAQARRLLRSNFNAHTVATTLLATMDGLQLRYVLTPDAPRIDEAFAALAGQVLADLVHDSPSAAAVISAWRRKHAPAPD